MKLFILFVINDQGNTLEINSGLRWFNTDQPRITDMDDRHLKNARCWLYLQICSLNYLGYDQPIKNGYSYSQWLVILGKEEQRRKDVKQAIENARIEKLKIAAMSVATRKKKANNLLDNPTAENVALAEKLLGFEVTTNDIKEHPFPNAGNRTYDYVDQGGYDGY